ncbi:MAG TPA: GWxTD domain-containing protein [Bryobacteraceae bacterium]|jgi:GWxTD domain-containing protein
MSILEAIIHAPLAKALGWSLVHFLWEGAVIALLLGLLLLLCGPAPAKLRYALCCLAMLAMPLAFGLTVALTLPAPHTAPALALPPPPSPDAGDALRPAFTDPKSLLALLRNALPWLVPFWMAGVLVFYLRSLGGWMAAQRLRRTGVCLAPAAWQERLHTLRARLGLSQPVLLLESLLIDTPVAMGFLRPAILVPVGLLMGLSTDQLESILVHELAHIRRRDYLVNLLQSFVESLLFYHPAVWWVSGLVRGERENCCDDVVVELKGDPRSYAAALATLEINRWPAREPALAATGGSLMKRIQRLLQEPQRPRAATAPIFATGLLIVAFAVGLGGWQGKPAPAPMPARQAALAAPAPAPRSAAILVAQAQDQPQPPQAKKRADEVQTPYIKWLNEDVAYIITDAERAAFKSLTSDPEREHFIEQFWLRRDPTPGTPENEFKQEHYRRIAYANDHFGSNLVAGWKTDRGRIYITYGPPDEIESHKNGGSYQRPAAEGGGTTTTFPFEKWLYRFIQDVGNNVVIEFVDPTMTGEYRMTTDPSEKDALRFVAPPAPATAKAGGTIQLIGNGAAVVSVPLAAYADHRVNVVINIVSATRRAVANFEDTVQGPAPAYAKFVALPKGTYRVVVTVRDTTTNALAKDDLPFEVK